MGYDWEKLYEGPRTEKRSKRRKTNRIFNILIALVFILILFFGGRLLFGKEEPTKQVSSTTQENSQEQSSGAKETENDRNTGDDKSNQTNTDASPSDETNQSDRDTTEETTNEEVVPESTEGAIVSAGDPESNVIRTIENPAWQPIGTTQSQPETNNYDEDTKNRIELEKAASYATGLDRANMTVWWLTNNGAPDKAKVTIATRDGLQIYRVYVDWIESEGWQPILVEELKENDSPFYKNQNAPENEDDNDDE